MWISKLLEEKLHASKAIGRLIVGAIDRLFVVNPFVKESDCVDIIWVEPIHRFRKLLVLDVSVREKGGVQGTEQIVYLETSGLCEG